MRTATTANIVSFLLLICKTPKENAKIKEVVAAKRQFRNFDF
jgi:hypothetical protein